MNLAIIISLLIVAGHAERVVIVTMQMGGHLSESGGVARGLIDIGHDVFILMDENAKKPPQLRDSGVKVISYASSDAKSIEMIDNYERDLSEVMIAGGGTDAVVARVMKPRIEHDCLTILRDDSLMRTLAGYRFDMAIVEGLYFCNHLIPYKLNVSFVSMSTVIYPYITKTHPLVTPWPCSITEQSNTFANRMRQFLYSLFFENFVPHIFLDEKKFLGFVADEPHGSLYEIAEQSKLWLINKDNLLDCARPSQPNVIYIGGISAAAPKPLPTELEDFLDSAADAGAIVVTHSSMMAHVSETFTQKLMHAFSRIGQKILMRLVYRIPGNVTIPSNVKIVDWIPQNDVLAHRNVRLFITHCGNNGQSEALYHGVPMLGLPLFGDQMYNAERVVVKGYGLKLDTEKFTSDDLQSAIHELLNNSNFTRNIGKASAIFKSRPHPRDQAAYWIDHVMKYGDQHLKTSTNYMSTAQFLMFDIFGSLLFVLQILIFALHRTVVRVTATIWSKIKNKRSPKTEHVE
ncbi:2-hydroxyacylsphingosine 1-beta-galactosyltransferase-like [Tubulanus polymorphus]|uniref:2-hydroxyacylsphingosine 1-beta-galactosyltransferase-like n=1 Tax=Tubulanus polymorphus TaxID=672921 RepID=UPI003DA37016